ncbi:extracellular catalytic domain type 1 short-chain-length polyhydroxyalkanoate depolymerase [Mesorhizobium wenxiniae]|uniref:extracellular catalytic domain type 1 short-chain-length polyhydroxyalkanoate depolymerase n=1 Tax=Mesorhizobium wenxiniae TaxID=2014805 RepID=UPI0013FD93F4|nr:PHB depolymerase family esterase [Mesorhizobium wenxiniae]
MRNIPDTIARLTILRARQPLWEATNDKDRLSDLTGFGSNPGALRARVYVPAKLPEGAALVVVLHGCTQSATGYDHGSGWSLLAEQEGFAVLFPEQQRANNANLCFNWFVPGDIRRDSGEALSIRQMVEALVVAHKIDRERIFVTKLSAGGAMTSVMLSVYPDVFAGGAIIAGLAYGSATTIPEAFDRVRGHGGPSEQELPRLVRAASSHKGPWPTVSIWHGTADNTVVPFNADAILVQWQGVHSTDANPKRSETVDGHMRQVWCDTSGRELIEKFSIAGMGHGAPLKTPGDNGLGSAGPFMLDVGISSTRHIACFWGIMETGAQGSRTKISADAATLSGTILQPAAKRRKNRGRTTLSRQERRPLNAVGSQADVTKVIEDALRAAGLMQ